MDPAGKIQSLFIAAHIHPDHVEVREELAFALFEAERWNDLIQQGSEIIKLWPSSAFGYLVRAAGFQGHSQNPEAQADLKAASACPDHAALVQRNEPLFAAAKSGVASAGNASALDEIVGHERLKSLLKILVLERDPNADLIRSYGLEPFGGILMYGPPGCGKTFIAHALATSLQARFLSVSVSDILDRFIGESAKKIRSCFEQARLNAPSVLFFDEVDSLAADRQDFDRAPWAREPINEFLTQLDGVRGDNKEVLVIAASNLPWLIDPAFRRPGRLTRNILIPPLEGSGRRLLLERLLRETPTENLDLSYLTDLSALFSGAELRGWVEQAKTQALQTALESGSPVPVRQEDMVRIAASIQPAAQAWFQSARYYGRQDPLLTEVDRFLDSQDEAIRLAERLREQIELHRLLASGSDRSLKEKKAFLLAQFSVEALASFQNRIPDAVTDAAIERLTQLKDPEAASALMTFLLHSPRVQLSNAQLLRLERAVQNRNEARIIAVYLKGPHVPDTDAFANWLLSSPHMYDSLSSLRPLLKEKPLRIETVRALLARDHDPEKQMRVLEMWRYQLTEAQRPEDFAAALKMAVFASQAGDTLLSPEAREYLTHELRPNSSLGIAPYFPDHGDFKSHLGDLGLRSVAALLDFLNETLSSACLQARPQLETWLHEFLSRTTAALAAEWASLPGTGTLMSRLIDIARNENAFTMLRQQAIFKMGEWPWSPEEQASAVKVLQTLQEKPGLPYPVKKALENHPLLQNAAVSQDPTDPAKVETSAQTLAENARTSIANAQNQAHEALVQAQKEAVALTHQKFEVEKTRLLAEFQETLERIKESDMTVLEKTALIKSLGEEFQHDLQELTKRHYG